MAQDVDIDILINLLQASIEQARIVKFNHTEFLLRMALLEVADRASGGRLMKRRKKPLDRKRRTSRPAHRQPAGTNQPRRS